jgi:DnaD/phage-associated family protein
LLHGTGWFAAPNWVFDSDELNKYEKYVYLYLCRMAGGDGSSWPSVARMAKDTDLGQTVVREALQGLVSKGALHIQHQINKETGGQTSNLYTIQTPFAGRTHPLRQTEAPPSQGDDEGLPNEVQPKEVQSSSVTPERLWEQLTGQCINPLQAEHLQQAFEDGFEPELIKWAMQQTRTEGKHFGYFLGILRTLKQQGIFTVAQHETHEAARKADKQPKPAPKQESMHDRIRRLRGEAVS